MEDGGGWMSTYEGKKICFYYKKTAKQFKMLQKANLKMPPYVICLIRVMDKMRMSITLYISPTILFQMNPELCANKCISCQNNIFFIKMSRGVE